MSHMGLHLRLLGPASPRREYWRKPWKLIAKNLAGLRQMLEAGKSHHEIAG